MQSLTDYDWPGNLDELRKTIESLAKKTLGELVTVDDLPDRFQHALQAQQIGGNSVPAIQLDQYLANIEKQLIERALSKADHNKARACKLLGISRAKLGRRIQQLEIGQTDTEPVVFEVSEEDDD